ncbi:transposase InsO family protein [Methylobacterium sp. PvR107]|nr:transposase InsO family protein [Methylobacterium sp. PvR107]
MIDVLSDLFILRGVPGHVHSDNGPEFIAKSVQARIAAVGAKTAHIAPGSPWENGSVESFNARLRDELLGSEIFTAHGDRNQNRELASTRQHGMPTWTTRLQAAGARSVLASHGGLAGCACPTGSVGEATRGTTA